MLLSGTGVPPRAVTIAEYTSYRGHAVAESAGITMGISKEVSFAALSVTVIVSVYGAAAMSAAVMLPLITPVEELIDRPDPPGSPDMLYVRLSVASLSVNAAEASSGSIEYPA